MFTSTQFFKKPIFAILLVAMLLSLVGCQKGDTGTVSIGTSTPKYTFEAEQTKETTKATITAGIEIPGYDALYVDAGATTMEGDFFNPESNNVYFRISFYVEEEEAPFYQSALIEPGQHLYRLELDKTYDKGTYDMRIVYESFSTDGNYAPRNGANVACKLIVE